jgi:hypothetical protein
MDEHMNPYEAEKKFPLMAGHRSNIPLLYPESKFDSVISNSDNDRAS